MHRLMRVETSWPEGVGSSNLESPLHYFFPHACLSLRRMYNTMLCETEGCQASDFDRRRFVCTTLDRKTIFDVMVTLGVMKDVSPYMIFCSLDRSNQLTKLWVAFRDSWVLCGREFLNSLHD